MQHNTHTLLQDEQCTEECLRKTNNAGQWIAEDAGEPEGSTLNGCAYREPGQQLHLARIHEASRRRNYRRTMRWKEMGYDRTHDNGSIYFILRRADSLVGSNVDHAAYDESRMRHAGLHHHGRVVPGRTIRSIQCRYQFEQFILRRGS